MRILAPYTAAVFFSAALFAAGAQPARVATPVSTAVTALEAAVRKGTPRAEAAFWERVKRDGTPLVEPIAGDTSNLLFTFVWHGDSATRNVALVNTAVASNEPAQALLARLPGTDVWYRSYPARADARFSYELSVNDNLVPFDQVDDWRARSATFHRDPFNARAYESGFGRVQSIAEGPRAPREEWIAERPGVAKGRVEQTTVASKLLGTTRDVWVYTPVGYDTLARSGGLPLLMTFDGGQYVSSIPGPTILDNLIAAKRIAPMVAVFVASAENQRDEELRANGRYVEFLATELVPWIRSKYHISSSPAGNVIAGASLGGLSAGFVAYKHPELFANVLSQSGAFMYSTPGDSAAEMLKRDITASPRLDVKFYLQAGIYENYLKEHGVDLLASNQHLRDALRAKGYQVTYEEYAGGHSDLNWRTGFANGLLALVGK